MKGGQAMDNERYKDKVITIPNILSFVRILLIPFFVWAYSFKNDVLLTVIILAASALTSSTDSSRDASAWSATWAEYSTPRLTS